MIDDVHAQLGKTVYIGFPRSEVAAFDGVVEQTPDAVAVVLVVLRGVDTALGGNAVGPTGGV